MKIRDFLETDESRIKELYEAQKFDYPLPEPKEFLEDLILTDDHNRPMMRIAALNMVELYLIVDPDYETPGMRFEHFKLLHEAMRIRLQKQGVVGAHIFLPPQIKTSFARRLKKKLGWVQSNWTCLFRRV